MRPAGISKSSPCRISRRPKLLRRPRAETMGSAEADRSVIVVFPLGRFGCRCGKQLVHVEVERRNLGSDAGPFLGEELFAFMREQLAARSGFDKHAQTPAFFDDPDIDQSFESLGHG